MKLASPFAEQPDNTPATPAEPPPAQETPPPPPRRSTNPAAQWWQAMRADTAARKARGAGWWAMRWTGEQPTSVADHLDYLLRQKTKRPGGRKGWGLRTEAALIDSTHAFFYVTFGLVVALPVTLACYALAWMCQRPGRALLLAAALWLVRTNLDTWLT